MLRLAIEERYIDCNIATAGRLTGPYWRVQVRYYSCSIRRPSITSAGLHHSEAWRGPLMWLMVLLLLILGVLAPCLEPAVQHYTLAVLVASHQDSSSIVTNLRSRISKILIILFIKNVHGLIWNHGKFYM